MKAQVRQPSLFHDAEYNEVMETVGGKYIQWVVENCPEEFKKDNPWSRYARWFIFMRGDVNTDSWNWSEGVALSRSRDRIIHGRMKYLCGTAVMQYTNFTLRQKISIVCWMMYESLDEVPTIPPRTPLSDDQWQQIELLLNRVADEREQDRDGPGEDLTHNARSALQMLRDLNMERCWPRHRIQ